MKRAKQRSAGKKKGTPNGLRRQFAAADSVRHDPAGRVHLVVQHDPNAGTPRIALSAPLFREAWQNEVAVSTASTAYLSLDGSVNFERVVALTEHTLALASKLADGLLAGAANGGAACRAGCDHCCHQSVGVTPAEVMTLVAFVRKTFSSEQRGELARRVALARERTAGLSSRERFSPDHPCPFLDASRCSVYEVRPLACRGVNSLDADECRRELRDPKTRAAFVAAGVGGKAYLEPIRAAHAVSAGLQLGLSELFGLDMQPLDLVAAADALLNGPADLSEQWIAGHTPLDAARGGECSPDATAKDLRGAR